MQSDYHRLALKETAPQLYHNHTVVKNVMKNLLKHSYNLKHDSVINIPYSLSFPSYKARTHCTGAKMTYIFGYKVLVVVV